MSWLLSIAVSNLFVASVIAMLALLADRLVRRPALTHGLWLLFFLKLLTPPLLTIPVAWTLPTLTQAEEEGPPINEAALRQDAEREPTEAADEKALQQLWPGLRYSEGPEAVTSSIDSSEPGLRSTSDPVTSTLGAKKHTSLGRPPPLRKRERAPSSFREEEEWRPMAERNQVAELLTVFPWAEAGAGLWLFGSLSWFSLAAARLLRFRRQLGLARPALGDLQGEAARLAKELEVSCPGVWILPGPLSPMLWVLGRVPRLLVPAGLLERLDDMQRQALLVHELAHWRRRDHWVRWLELVALGLYWWCPLVWWARRHMQEAEEECCDAWVVWLMPGAARGYALALVETVDFLAGARAALPPAASGIGQVRLLKRRLTMIMRGTTPRALTFSGSMAVLGLGALLLPLMPIWAQPAPVTVVQPPREGAPQAFPGGPSLPPSAIEQSTPDSGDSVAAQRQALEAAARDIQRMQAELDHARQKLELHSQDLHQKMAAIQARAAEMARQMARSEDAGPANPDKRGRGVGGFPGTLGAMPGNPSADMNRRLDQVERKLDMLIQMVRQSQQSSGGAGGSYGPVPSPRRP